MLLSRKNNCLDVRAIILKCSVMLAFCGVGCQGRQTDVSTQAPTPFLSQETKRRAAEPVQVAPGITATPNSVPIANNTNITPTATLEAKPDGQLFQMAEKGFPPQRMESQITHTQDASPSVSTMKVLESGRSRHPLESALQAFLDHKPQEAMQFLSRYDRTDQEIVLALLPILAGAEQPFQERPAEQRSGTIDSLHSLCQRLKEKAPLKLRNVMYYQGAGVKNFGVVERRETAVFRSGEYLQIYAELENLTDRKSTDGTYKVRLETEIRISDEHGEKWHTTQHTPFPVSFSPRQDFFVNARLILPPDMPPGHYRLAFRVTDLDTGRNTEQVMPLQLINPVRVAQKDK